MSWTRKQKLYRTNKDYINKISQRYMDSAGSPDGIGASGNKFSSTLPEVYAGHPLRIERYTQYDQMDMDSEVNNALGIIANYCTQDDPDNDLKFRVNYNENVSDSEMEVTETVLRQWCKLNKFKTRMWRMFRSTLKYGDQFFLRDPETLEWYFIDPAKVEKVLVNEAEGKEVEAYIVRDLDINRTMKTASQPDTYGNDLQGQSTNTLQNQVGYQNRYGNVTHYGHYSDGIQNVLPIAAEHIVHLSLSEGLDASWPFGTSILESIFKVFRQKELLEDAILIYRIQRAPERRVFYVDVGQIPPNRANAYLDRFKNEIQQRRIPSRNGGSCFTLDTKIKLLDGRSLPLQECINEYQQGKQLWTYSIDPNTKKVIPGMVTWAGITRKNTEIVKMTLDNGKVITCTPDHKFPIQTENGYIIKEAKDILINSDSLFPLYTRENTINKSKNSYEQVYTGNEWKYTHREIKNYFRNHNEMNDWVKDYTFDEQYRHERKCTIHHKDFNRYNNNPDNLLMMNNKDHIAYHGSLNQNWKFNEKLWNIFLNFFENNDCNKTLILEYLNNNNEFMNELRNINKPEVGKHCMFNINEPFNIHGLNAMLKYHNTSMTDLLENNNRSRTNHTIKLKFNDKLKNMAIKLLKKNKFLNRDQFAELLNSNHDFINEFIIINNECNSYNYNNEFALHSLVTMMCYFEYENYDNFRKTILGNEYKPVETIYMDIKINNLLKDEIIKTAKNKFLSRKKLYNLLKNNKVFMNEFNKINFMKNTNKKFHITTMDIILKKLGWNSYNDFSDEVNELDYDIKITPEMKIHLDGYFNGKKKYNRASNLKEAIQRNKEFVQLFKLFNPSFKNHKIDARIVNKFLNFYGFADFNEFSKEIYFNHKVISIEFLEEKQDTGTLTIDYDEIFNNFHNFALDVGVFTQNSTISDTSYQPLSQIDDYYFAVGEGGRSSRVEILPGGENLGSINDLVWWNNKLIRGLGVPSGYLPFGPEDGGVTYNDGRLGTAYQQEFNFAQYCMRLQNLLIETFDKEFKLFLKQRGYNIDASSFNIDFVTPQHFSEYANIERDAAAIGNFQTMVGMPFISPRFAMEKWLGMSKADIAENERYVLEENPEEETPNDETDDNGLSSMGIRGGDDFGGDMGDDIDLGDDTGGSEGDESPISGDDTGDDGLDLPT